MSHALDSISRVFHPLILFFLWTVRFPSAPLYLSVHYSSGWSFSTTFTDIDRILQVSRVCKMGIRSSFFMCSCHWNTLIHGFCFYHITGNPVWRHSEKLQQIQCMSVENTKTVWHVLSTRAGILKFKGGHWFGKCRWLRALIQCYMTILIQCQSLDLYIDRVLLPLWFVTQVDLLSAGMPDQDLKETIWNQVF